MLARTHYAYTPGGTMAIDPTQWTQEEIFMSLQDVLTECAADRTEGHTCPCDEKAGLDCERDNGWIRVKCTQCRLKFDGFVG